MAIEIAVVPHTRGLAGRAAYVLIPADIIMFLCLGIWTVNEFHLNLRPHFILFVSGTLALSYYIFNLTVKGAANENPDANH